MTEVLRYRAMSSLCRQHAAYNPSQSWKLLADAERWDHLAEAEMSSHAQQCNPAGSREPARMDLASAMPRKTVAAA
jgi:hypothetical protein